MALVVKNPAANTGDVRDTGSVPGSGRSPGGGRDNLASVLACRIPWTGEAGRVCRVTQRQTTGVTEHSLVMGSEHCPYSERCILRRHLIVTAVLVVGGVLPSIPPWGAAVLGVPRGELSLTLQPGPHSPGW